MRRKLTIALLVAALVLSAAAATWTASAGIQAQVTQQDAIALAAGHAAFADALALRPGWTAAAYDSDNAYGIWRVQFWDAGGEDLGWADVSVERGRVYSWETHYGAVEPERRAAEAIVREFILQDPQVRELLEDPSQYAMYVDYDGWNRAWGVWVDRGADSLYFLVRFEGESPSSLDNPALMRIYFPHVLSYAEWYAGSQSEAVSTAFSQAEIAAAVRGHEGWSATAEIADEDHLWTVRFTAGGQTLAEAMVDLDAGTVISYSTP